jgi:hypothetical protein
MISWGQGQGCQIALGKTDTNVKNIPNDHRKYQMTTQNTKWPQKISNNHIKYQMTTENTKLPQNIPNYHRIYQNYHRIHQINSKYTKLPQYTKYLDIE